MVTKRQLQSMDPYEFEELVAELWDSKGYTTNVRKKSGDKGVDIEADRGGRKEVIQVKRYSDGNKIGSEEVRKYATLYQQTDANQVVLVTSGEFTSSARELADDLGVEDIDGDELVRELNRNNVRVDGSSSKSSQSTTNETPDVGLKWLIVAPVKLIVFLYSFLILLYAYLLVIPAYLSYLGALYFIGLSIYEGVIEADVVGAIVGTGIGIFIPLIVGVVGLIGSAIGKVGWNWVMGRGATTEISETPLHHYARIIVPYDKRMKYIILGKEGHEKLENKFSIDEEEDSDESPEVDGDEESDEFDIPDDDDSKSLKEIREMKDSESN